MDLMNAAKSCIKPFSELKNIKKCSEDRRDLSEDTIQNLQTLGYSKNVKICSSCRLHVKRLVNAKDKNISIAGPSAEATENIVPVIPSDTDILPEVPSAESLVQEVFSAESLSTKSVDIEIFNQGLSAIKVLPVDFRKIKNIRYPEEKIFEITQAIRHHIFGLELETQDDSETSEFDEMISQLKEKFSSGINRKEQLQLLTVLPKSWTIQKIMDEFNIPRYFAKKAKDLLDANQIHSFPGSHIGHGITEEEKDIVVRFFEDDEISRALPGQRDFVSIKKGGKRVAVQKRLLMSTLKETYERFKEVHDLKIGFSSFARLRPKYCKLLTATGTHNVCVCTIHENMKLMMRSINKFSANDNLDSLTSKVLCKNQTVNCFLRSCGHCSGTKSLKKYLSDKLEENMIDQISFEQWITTDRCDIETIVKDDEKFVSYFCDKISKLIPHDFIKKEQFSFLKNTKDNLKEGEFLVILDFSENYTFVLQDEVQSHHWNAKQATIHPFMIYYRENSQLCHFSFIVISDELRHDSVAVNLFITKMISFLTKTKQKNVKKIYFMTDGAACQYKNRKKIASLCQYETKHGIDVEWHFFATSHGKGPCDAIGGTIKRMAARASLAKESEHPIKTAQELYDWAKSRADGDFTKLSFCFVTSEEYEQAKLDLNSLYDSAQPIQGTQRYHAFIPVSINEIEVKRYSTSIENGKLFTIIK